MDYSANYLAKEVQCTDEVLSGSFDAVKFGKIGDVEVFDATEFCILSEINPVDYKVFSRANKRNIEILIDAGIVDRKELFYITPNGHLLINNGLTTMFLAFIDKNIYIYFWSLLNEILYNGIALSDSYIASLIINKIPNNTLEEIINIRKNDQASSTDSVQQGA